MIQKQNIDIRTSLNLTMTPRLQEAIQILQMSSCELKTYTQNILNQNPLLEEGFPSHQLYSPLNHNQKNDDFSIWDTLKAEQTLHEFIFQQVSPYLNDKEKHIAHILIHSLNDDGYLKEDLTSLTQQHQLSLKTTYCVLKQLKRCEPIGIFSQSLQECFKTQLIFTNQLTPKMEQFIDSLDQIPHIGLKTICKNIAISYETGEGFLKVLQKLQTKPAMDFATHEKDIRIPDLIVFVNEQKQLEVHLNPEALPHIFFNSTYYDDLIQKTTHKKNDINYLKNCKKESLWFLEAIHQRSQNLLKIGSFLIEHQKDFFYMGKKELKPLTLKDVTHYTSLHASTISRLTTNKYIETPHGIFDLKLFFSSKVATSKRFKKNNDDSINVSSTKVKYIIEQFIKEEEKKHPLSDEDIATLLKQQGILIARRTVAKYRIALGIDSSSNRRKLF